MTPRLLSAAALLAAASPLAAQEVATPPVAERSATDGERLSPGDTAARYAERIAAIDDAGPTINSVIVYDTNPREGANAINGASLLAGRTVLVKDNIETSEWPTTAGSLALIGNKTGRDAPLIANLRRNGGFVLGKTNLSEWANIRDNDSTSGWSAVGGLTRNPHAIDRNACGSSSGSGAAVAAGLAWAAIGTETNGSITCPASINGIVGFKPSVGLVSRTHVVPISSTQDTAGPMTQTVADAALLLSAIAGEDSADAATIGVPRQADYWSGLGDFSLQGVRIGVMRKQVGNRDDLKDVFETALGDLEKAGAIIVDIEFDPNTEMYGDSFTVLMFELREEMGKYLASLPGENLPRSLAELIAFNTFNAGEEMRWFGQDLFELAVTTTDRAAYEKARENAVRIAGVETLDKLMADNDVAFLVAPTRGPTWTTDLVNGDNFNGSIGFGSPAAIAGYPHLTVPMGQIEALPVGISFFGGKWRDFEVLQLGAAYERVRSAELATPSLQRWSPPAEADK
ncbi:amidase [Qipengyuania gaetbuli]|uniref:amidase n=1 Tax=Qipengyuania gaetbuli TaxID=266952 RepID=UPI001CD21B85|nr:amidase [Qipengyuania gaetbuli]MCA0909562.1 amidase [Qipengyuania gaetbuli]